MPALTDKFSKTFNTTNPTVAKVTVVRSTGGTTLQCNNLTGWPTDTVVQFSTYGITADSKVNVNTLTDWKGIVSGNNITSLTRVAGAADNGNLIDDVVELNPTANWGNELVGGILAQHNQDGSHGAVTAASLTVSGATTLSGATTITTPPSNAARFTGEITSCFLRTAPSGWLFCDGAAVSRSTYSALFAALFPSLGTFTVTIASPAVVTMTAHGLETGQGVYLTTTGALPTGLTANTQYFAIKVDANTLRLATTQANADAGTAINTSGSQSGTHTMVFAPAGVGDGSTTFNVPDFRGRVLVGMDASQTEFSTLGKSGGFKTHTLTINEMPAHSHGVNASSNTGGSLGARGNSGTDISVFQTTSQGGGAAHNNLQPYLTVNKIIKT